MERSVLMRLRSVLIVASLVFAGIVGMAGEASADVTPIKYGTTWLGGNGVNVCPASTDTTCGGQAHVGGYSGNWWQCVELAQRLYKTRGWFTGIFPGVNYAHNIFDTLAAPGNTNGFTRQDNGSITSVAPGDMLVFSGGIGGTGHVGVVDTITDNSNGTKTLSVVNQNAYEVSSNVTWTLSTGMVSKYSYMDGHSADTTFSVMGMVHNTNDTLTGSTGSTTPTYNLQAPSAITDPATGRNIFYVGADGYIWQWSVIGGAWSNVKLQGSGNPETVQPGTSPSAVLDSATGRNVFYVGTDQTIWQWSVQGGAWVNSRLGSVPVMANTSPSALSDASSGRNVFYIGADQYVYQLSVQNGAWVNIKLTVNGNAIAAAQETSPSAIVDPSAGREVFYVGADNQIYQWSVQNNAWADIKLTGTGGNRAAATGSSPSAVVDPSTGSNVFYVGDDNHIWQWSVQNGAWNDFQISGTGGNQTVLAGTSPSAVVDPTTGRNVFYVGPDNQIWQWSVQNGQWNNNTLTNSTGGTVGVLAGTSPGAVSDPSSGRNVFYFDGHKMVWQWSVQNNAWVDFQLQ